MAYILDGTPTALENMLREQRVRIERGDLVFTPIDAGAVLPGEGGGSGGSLPDGHDCLDQLKEQTVAMEKACRQMVVMHDTLADLTAEVVDIALQVGADIPDELTSRLEEAGIVVSGNEAAYVPKSMMFDFGCDDDKGAVFAGCPGMAPVADSKDTSENDTKDVPQADAKEAKATPAKSAKAKE